MELSENELYGIILIISKYIMDNEKELHNINNKDLKEYYSTEIKEATVLREKLIKLRTKQRMKSKS